MFNPYEPGAFERARSEILALRENPKHPYLKANFLALLDRLERDPEYRAEWYQKRKCEFDLYERFGPQVIAAGMKPPEAG